MDSNIIRSGNAPHISIPQFSGSKTTEGALSGAKEEEHEKMLEHAVAHYMTTINAVPALLYVKDSENRYIVANIAFCRAIDKELSEILGKTDSEILPPEKAENWSKLDKEVMETNREIVNEEKQVIDDGERKWVVTTKIPIRDENGSALGLVSTIQDVTEIHQSREQLMQSDKLAAIGTLAAGVAHEINNPIGYVNSNLNTMKKYLTRVTKFVGSAKDVDKEELEDINEIIADFKDAVDESIEGTSRVKKIVADLKSFSRVDRAEMEYTDVNEGINSTLNIVWNELKYKCKVEKEFGELPDLYCIPNQLNQVFMNLLINAGHAIKGDDGLVKIKTWADSKHIYVSIKDNGCGISEKNQKKIFEPFFTTKEVGKGTGLGLSLVFDIIKRHNGSIDVQSEVGVGSEFTITLPIEGVKDA